MSDFDVFEFLDWDESFNSTQDICKKLSIRDKIHWTLTRKVLGEVVHPLTEAVNLFSGTTDIIDWAELDLIPGIDDYVKVLGYSLPSAGNVILVNGNKVQITEENKTKYKKVIRFVLPIKLLNPDKVDLLADFIKDISAIANISTDYDMETLLRAYMYNDLQRLTDSPIYYKIMDKATKPKEAFGFDLTDLNDQQIKSLFLMGPSFDEEGKAN